jgi:hypothetical protein
MLQSGTEAAAIMLTTLENLTSHPGTRHSEQLVVMMIINHTKTLRYVWKPAMIEIRPKRTIGKAERGKRGTSRWLLIRRQLSFGSRATMEVAACLASIHSQIRNPSECLQIGENLSVTGVSLLCNIRNWLSASPTAMSTMTVVDDVVAAVWLIDEVALCESQATIAVHVDHLIHPVESLILDINLTKVLTVHLAGTTKTMTDLIVVIQFKIRDAMGRAKVVAVDSSTDKTTLYEN